MKHHYGKFLAGLAAIICMAVVASCGSGGSGGSVHDQNLNGVLHASGKENPLKNCTDCHGSDLKGGSGPSCFQCHNSADHTQACGGVMHHAGAESTCTACHGPNNTGGLGPACAQCH